MFVLRDRRSGCYLASGLVLLADEDDAITFPSADAAQRLAGRGWCAEVQLSVVALGAAPRLLAS